MQDKKDVLRARLRNCLLTIVEMEPIIKDLDLQSALSSEFRQVKEFSGRVSGLDLSQSEVEKIEEATALFLQELEFSREWIEITNNHILQ